MAYLGDSQFFTTFLGHGGRGVLQLLDEVASFPNGHVELKTVSNVLLIEGSDLELVLSTAYPGQPVGSDGHVVLAGSGEAPHAHP